MASTAGNNAKYRPPVAPKPKRFRSRTVGSTFTPERVGSGTKIVAQNRAEETIPPVEVISKVLASYVAC